MQQMENERSNPHVAARVPIVLDLEPGTYHWCACGQSKGQPFCDGSHQGTSFSPVEITVHEKEKVAFCQCKHSSSGHRCDGSHRNL